MLPSRGPEEPWRQSLPLGTPKDVSYILLSVWPDESAQPWMALACLRRSRTCLPGGLSQRLSFCAAKSATSEHIQLTELRRHRRPDNSNCKQYKAIVLVATNSHTLGMALQQIVSTKVCYVAGRPSYDRPLLCLFISLVVARELQMEPRAIARSVHLESLQC